MFCSLVLSPLKKAQSQTKVLPSIGFSTHQSADNQKLCIKQTNKTKQYNPNPNQLSSRLLGWTQTEIVSPPTPITPKAFLGQR